MFCSLGLKRFNDVHFKFFCVCMASEINVKMHCATAIYSYLGISDNFISTCRKYRQRLSHDVLVSLSNALLDGTVFQIVSGIHELQRMEESHLYSERNQRIAYFNGNYNRSQVHHK